jgi:DNA polymerase-3 subunit gamma/tau
MTDYIPLTLKYRPKKLADLIGQDVLRKTLLNAIDQGKVHHSYLLYGPYGCGKTSTARIIAASLNCEKGITSKPCGKCANCAAIFVGESIDVLEMDAASNRGINEIRGLQELAKYGPTNGRYKIFIIDEAHQLTGDAAEAMLKVLEEPPPNIKFILCTTERHKLKDTVLSRCQDFKVKTLPWNLIAAHVKDICQKEAIEADVEAIKVIAKTARGHMRDALKNLDTVVMYAGGTSITKETANTSLGEIDEELFFTLFDCIIERKYADGARCIQDMLLNGQNIESTLGSLTDHLRCMLLIRLCDSTSGLLLLSDEEKKRYLHQAQQLSPDAVDEMIKCLVENYRGLFFNVSPQILLEQWLLNAIRSNVKNPSK